MGRGASYLIGVDLGTSATKAAIYDTDGELIASATVGVALQNPSSGIVEQDTHDFYTSAAEAVRSCVRESGIDPRAVAAIAFDSQMAGVATIDSEFLPATRFDSWLDMRCAPQIDRVRSDFGPLVTRLTGCPPTCDHGPKMLWWKEERPKEYAKISKFLMPSAYVAGRLAGIKVEEAFIDHTFLHFTGLTDTARGEWSSELLERFGIDRAKLPRIVEPWEVIGEVSESGARDFDLAEGTIIAAGCGDTAACALGAGAVRQGMLFDTAGTASVLAATTERFIADEKNEALLCMRSVIPGLWHPLAYIGGGGLALTWFIETFTDGDMREAGDEERERSFDTAMADAARISPGSDGLFFSPHLGGRICPSQPLMRGAWVGFTWRHTKDHFFRAILESIAYEYGLYLQVIRDLVPGVEFSEARVVGGGARGALWNQIKADVLDVPYRRLVRRELGSWGAAMVAGRAAGLFPDLAETATRCSYLDETVFGVNKTARGIYRPIAHRYLELSKELERTFQTITMAGPAAAPEGVKF
ncbi:MAG TPA: FGGY family carbohydrate kinase [Spirochaetia bacterium]|nr:FGGY family carbohydrate kinase [Spirochaetia bacterium]